MSLARSRLVRYLTGKSDEGKSLMSSDRYHRFASHEKVQGVDDEFYRNLLRGACDAEITALVMA